MYLPNQRFIYSFLAFLLLITEIYIAVAIPATSFIRHSLGDFLVVILIYFTIRAFSDIDTKLLAIGTCYFAFLIELSQYFLLLDYLDITNKYIRIILGTSFSFSDLLMYLLGSIVAYLMDSHFIVKN